MLFIGVDPDVQRNAYCMAVLDEERKILALSTEKLRSVYAYLAGVTQGIVGINALIRYQHSRRTARPDRIDKPHFQSAAERKKPIPDSDPSTAAPSRLGGKVVTLQEGIESLGYNPIAKKGSPRRFFLSKAEEVFQDIVSGRLLPPGGDASRWQRQLLLLEQEIPLPDVMQYFEEVTRFRILQGTLSEELVYQHTELNAILLSWLGWLESFQPDRIKVRNENRVRYQAQPPYQAEHEED